MARATHWIKLCADPLELTLRFTLPIGQTFRWHPLSTQLAGSENEWVGVIKNRIVHMKQDDSGVFFTIPHRGDAESSKESVQEAEGEIRDWLNLDRVKIAPLYASFAQRDQRFAEVYPTFPGARILRQDPLECLFSFICSSNNHIKRIHSMVEALCSGYGTRLGEVDSREMFAFPSLDQLSKATEAELRAKGFGYRAKFIVQTVEKLRDCGGEEWLLALRGQSRAEVQAALTTLPGIGRKVASCIGLFALDQADEIPVDTHVWQIATRDYGMRFKGKALTEKIYEEIGAMFRERFPTYAGWAHTVLFVADVATFAKLLPEHLQRPPVQKAKATKAKVKTLVQSEPEDTAMKAEAGEPKDVVKVSRARGKRQIKDESDVKGEDLQSKAPGAGKRSRTKP